MATWTYEDVIPSLIENTTMQKGIADGVHRIYRITPINGYVLHHKNHDTDMDGDGNPIDPPILGYTPSFVTVSASYDFTVNPFEIYAVLRSTVPEDQIHGGGNNDHEVM